MGHIAFQLVQVVPSVSIKDGFVLVKGDAWGLCCTPYILRAFCEQGIRYLDQWEGEIQAPIPLFADRH